MTAPLMYEPTDPPTLPQVHIDRDDFDSITGRYSIEPSAADGRVYVVLDGVEFWTEMEVTA